MENARMLVDAPSIALKMLVWKAFEYYLEGDSQNCLTLVDTLMRHTGESQQNYIRYAASRTRQFYNKAESESMQETYRYWSNRLIAILLDEALADIGVIVVNVEIQVLG